MAFEAAGVDLATGDGLARFRAFLCENGPAHYGFPASTETFQMRREPSVTRPLDAPEGPVTPLPLGLGLTLDWTI